MDIANLSGANDPFGAAALDFDENIESDKPKKSKKKDDSINNDLVHIRVQQRNGRKCITTVQGLNQELDLKKILKTLKKQVTR